MKKGIIFISTLIMFSTVFSSTEFELGTVDQNNGTIEILITTSSDFMGFQLDVNGVELFSIKRFTYLQINFNFLFLNKAPGSKPVSVKIWKPLQIPITKPPLSACLITSFIMFDFEAMLPHLK